MTRYQNTYGPWAVVTGASSSIGWACADDLARRGLWVVLVARREDQIQPLADHLKARYGAEARVVTADLATREGQAHVQAETADLDVGLLVAAAGLGAPGRLPETDLDAEMPMLGVNGQAVVRQAHSFGQRFAARGRGGLVFFGSVGGFQGTSLLAHYAATKSFVQGLAEEVRLAFGSAGVDVIASVPGPVATESANVAHVKLGPKASPAKVAHGTLSKLGKRATAYPGLVSKILAGSLAFLPRWRRPYVIQQGMGRMTPHQQM
ncbi:MAG: SDR family NAD(P)-dependent oxidoreductase [Bacteroidota bacterium]